MKKVAVYPGSFDPITLGHLSVIRRAVPLFDELFVLVSNNPAKSPSFSLAERKDMVQESLLEFGISGVSVLELKAGLLVEQARELSAVALIKGFRTSSDIEYELPMAQVNRELSGIETVFLPSEPEFGFVSSSLIREVASLGGEVSRFVTKSVAQKLALRFVK